MNSSTRCELCDVSISSQMLYVVHINSDRHKEKLASRNAQKSTVLGNQNGLLPTPSELSSLLPTPLGGSALLPTPLGVSSRQPEGCGLLPTPSEKSGLLPKPNERSCLLPTPNRGSGLLPTPGGVKPLLSMHCEPSPRLSLHTEEYYSFDNEGERGFRDRGTLEERQIRDDLLPGGRVMERGQRDPSRGNLEEIGDGVNWCAIERALSGHGDEIAPCPADVDERWQVEGYQGRGSSGMQGIASTVEWGSVERTILGRGDSEETKMVNQWQRIGRAEWSGASSEHSRYPDRFQDEEMMRNEGCGEGGKNSVTERKKFERDNSGIGRDSCGDAEEWIRGDHCLTGAQETLMDGHQFARRNPDQRFGSLDKGGDLGLNSGMERKFPAIRRSSLMPERESHQQRMELNRDSSDTERVSGQLDKDGGERSRKRDIYGGSGRESHFQGQTDPYPDIEGDDRTPNRNNTRDREERALDSSERERIPLQGRGQQKDLSDGRRGDLSLNRGHRRELKNAERPGGGNFDGENAERGIRGDNRGSSGRISETEDHWQEKGDQWQERRDNNQNRGIINPDFRNDHERSHSTGRGRDWHNRNRFETKKDNEPSIGANVGRGSESRHAHGSRSFSPPFRSHKGNVVQDEREKDRFRNNDRGRRFGDRNANPASESEDPWASRRPENQPAPVQKSGKLFECKAVKRANEKKKALGQEVTASGKNTRSSVIDPVTNKSHVQKKLESMEEPAIGLQLIYEIRVNRPNGEVDLKYMCTLCNSQTDPLTIFSHLAGMKHKMAYLANYHMHYHVQIMRTTNKKVDRLPMLDEFASLIEADEGKQLMPVKECDSNEMETIRSLKRPVFSLPKPQDTSSNEAKKPKLDNAKDMEVATKPKVSEAAKDTSEEASAFAINKTLLNQNSVKDFLNSFQVKSDDDAAFALEASNILTQALLKYNRSSKT